MGWVVASCVGVEADPSSSATTASVVTTSAAFSASLRCASASKSLATNGQVGHLKWCDAAASLLRSVAGASSEPTAPLAYRITTNMF